MVTPAGSVLAAVCDNASTDLQNIARDSALLWTQPANIVCPVAVGDMNGTTYVPSRGSDGINVVKAIDSGGHVLWTTSMADFELWRGTVPPVLGANHSVYLAVSNGASIKVVGLDEATGAKTFDVQFADVLGLNAYSDGLAVVNISGSVAYYGYDGSLLHQYNLSSAITRWVNVAIGADGTMFVAGYPGSCDGEFHIAKVTPAGVQWTWIDPTANDCSAPLMAVATDGGAVVERLAITASTSEVFSLTTAGAKRWSHTTTFPGNPESDALRPVVDVNGVVVVASQLSHPCAQDTTRTCIGLQLNFMDQSTGVASLSPLTVTDPSKDFYVYHPAIDTGRLYLYRIKGGFTPNDQASLSAFDVSGLGTDYLLSLIPGAILPTSNHVTLTATPSTRTVGDHVTLLAQVTDNAGLLLPDTLIRFQVTRGPDTGFTAIIRTDATGTAGAVLQGKAAGTDTVLAWLDTNNNGAVDPGEATATTTVTWNTPPRKRYVVLGDSVPYGHGLVNPYPDGRPGSNGNNQGPSTDAYPSLVAAHFGLNMTVRPTGCGLVGDQLAISGAQVSDGNLPMTGNPPRIGPDDKCTNPSDLNHPAESVETTEFAAANLGQHPADLLTIQGGADDINYGNCSLYEVTVKTQLSSKIAKPCVTGGSYVKHSDGTVELVGGHASADFSAALGNLQRGLAHLITLTAPLAKHIAVINYYQPFPKPKDFNHLGGTGVAGLDLVCWGMASNLEHGYADSEFLRSALNTAIADGIADARRQSSVPIEVTLVDVSPVFNHHEMCTKSPAVFTGDGMNGARFGADLSTLATCKVVGSSCADSAVADIKRFVWRAGHPNRFGQTDLANAVITQLGPVLTY